jgi:inner membrane protein
LPESRSVSDEGFSAAWRVPYLVAVFPQAWTDAVLDRDKLKAQATAASFGVSFVQPVDIYQQAERAVKYASCSSCLTFVVFFLLWKLMRAGCFIPSSIVFIGFAICVFYLLLLSISEHVGFDVAYGVAATATTLLIGTYSVFALGARGREACFLGTAIAHSMVSSICCSARGLRAPRRAPSGFSSMLAVLMLATRRVNWYELASRAGRGAGHAMTRSPLVHDGPGRLSNDDA